MGKELSYDEICEELRKRNCEQCLMTSLDEFNNLREEQKKSGLYVKMRFRCSSCDKEYSKNLASIKASNYPWLCKSCALSHPTVSYEDAMNRIRENELTPLLNKEEYTGVRQKIRCVASCGHIVTDTIDSLMRNGKRMCRKCCTKGELAYNWNGGYDGERNRFRRTFESKQFVKSVLMRDDCTCQICGVKSNRTKIVVHHKDGYSWCVERRTDVSNGVTLCERCHKLFHKLYGNRNNTEKEYIEFERQYRHQRQDLEP